MLTASIIIATRGRPRVLGGCIGALELQLEAPLEIIVVDDGSTPALEIEPSLAGRGLTFVRSAGVGPSGARNLGAKASSGDVLLFTDDDTEPSPSWVEATLRWFKEHPEAVGVEGPTRSVPFDSLYECSVVAVGPGHYYTCNVAYRRVAFAEVGGFDAEVFPRYREDRDLAYRAMGLGEVGYCESMEVFHVPRTFDLEWMYRSHRASRCDIMLARRHPAFFAWENRVPSLLQPLTGSVKQAARIAGSELARRPLSLRRLVRAVLVAAATFAGTAVGVVEAVVKDRGVS